MHKSLLRYRIFNRVTHKWWEGSALSPHDALFQTGWEWNDCWIRSYTIFGGWMNVTPREI